MLKILRFNLEKQAPNEEDAELNKLNILLKSIGATACITINSNGRTIEIKYDVEDVKKKTTRSAGRKPKPLDDEYTLDEIKYYMSGSTAEEVAAKLGISRATLFRKIRNAEKRRSNTL